MKKLTHPICGSVEATMVSSRTSKGNRSRFTLSNGEKLESRRFLPLGKGDYVHVQPDCLWVFVKRDANWIDFTKPWTQEITTSLFGEDVVLTFKEIETTEELQHFSILQNLHYRGAGGAGRTIPLIAKSNIWDLPSVVGFIELSSSMIANSARKQFLDFPYREGTRILWKSWDRSAAREFSNMICRISRFVVHPEIRGLGLAKLFTDAAKSFAGARWHFGGFRPRFMEITADMLRYYPFLGSDFLYLGQTEGNEHRLQKDMQYLSRRALADSGRRGMPQGGGGIMTLQRGYATALLNYTNTHGKTLPDVIHSLKYDASTLDQETWEALHRLNRKPKPCYIAGLTTEAVEFIAIRKQTANRPVLGDAIRKVPAERDWDVKDVTRRATTQISQSKDGRILQDSFGFVGSRMESMILRETSFSMRASEVLLVCGASGSGKSLLLECLSHLADSHDGTESLSFGNKARVFYTGTMTPRAVIRRLVDLPYGVVPLDLLGRTPLEEFLMVTAQVGLAEPQLFVRPTESLSSGQKYRLQIALSILQGGEILAIDNFCENLDRFTIWAVCKGIRGLLRRYGMSAIVATAGYERIRRPLNADGVLLLRRGDSAILVDRTEMQAS